MKKYLLILILFFTTNLFSYNIVSWDLDSKYLNNILTINPSIRQNLEKYFDEIDAEVIVLQGLKSDFLQYLNLKNKHYIFIKTSNYYKKPLYYAFIIKNTHQDAVAYKYPNKEKIWKFPPVMLYVPKLALGLINIQTNQEKKISEEITGHSLNLVRREISDIPNVFNYFYRLNVTNSKFISMGDFGLESHDIYNILNYNPLLKEVKNTIINDNEGNYNNNVFTLKNNVKAYIIGDIYKQINMNKEDFSKKISKNYPILIKINN